MSSVLGLIPEHGGIIAVGTHFVLGTNMQILFGDVTKYA
jgi:hypothetical protein